jgi:hypothetical protein
MTTRIVPLALGAALALGVTGAHAATCEDLAKSRLKDAKVTDARAFAAGAPVEINGFGIPALPTAKAFCRVQATLTPVAGSEIRVEVWLPRTEAWNGKLMASGSGGYGGSLGPPRLSMRPALRAGYATAATDLGHAGDGSAGDDASWALGHPERVKDFGYRANHVTAEFAKAMVAAYYGAAPKRAYFNGCSDGGREALMEAQRYPGDFDGIVAGAPAARWTQLMTSMAWTWQSAHARPESRIPDAKLPLIQAAVLAQCDKFDGLADGVIDDPRACHFDPARVQCKAGDGADCLTAAQTEALRRIYSGPRAPGGRKLFPGYPAGGEATPNAWPLWITGEKAQHPSFARSFFSDLVYGDPTWDLPKLDLVKGLADARQRMGPILDSDNPDLSSFDRRGGKLILFHGWADAAITPYSTIEYFDAVRGRMGAAKVDGFARLFLAPGVSHCFGGPGPNSFDMLAALDAWVDKGQAPDQVIASKFENDYAGLLDLPPGAPVRTRPLCAYPKVAQWTGKGSSDEAANFVCKVPKA